MATNEDVLAELDGLEALHGIVRPEDVVEFAKDPNSALHSRFTWDDTEAARQHRLWQAREILRVAVRYVGDVDRRSTRAFVSLGSDRVNGGGYRNTIRVLDDADSKAELLEQAKAEARAWSLRYRELVELAAIRDAINATLAAV